MIFRFRLLPNKGYKRQPGLHLAAFNTLAFASGGNRCWWQAGVMKRLAEEGWKLPRSIVGTSGGAAVGAFCLTDGPDAALQACVRLFTGNERIFDWRGLMKAQLVFAHQEIYPAWVRTIIHADNFETLKQSGQSLLVAVSRPARALGLGASVTAGTLAHLIDENIWHSFHPPLPKALGLRTEFIDIRQCQSLEEAQALLIAAAAAPPFMSSLRVGGHWAFDGGYTDHAPIPPQTPAEKAATLVLLTRHYPGKPATFISRGRHYWQPSQHIPVSTWDVTSKATVEDAFALGYEDAHNAIHTRLLHDT